MKNNSLKYKIGQIVYNAINEAFDFNAEEIDTGNDYDAARDAYLFRNRENVNKILKDFYGISKFKKYEYAYSDNKIGNVYILDDRSSDESELTDKMINLLINQNFSTYYFSDMRDFAENTLGLSYDRYILSYSEPFEISSTKIRELIKENKDVKEFLSPEVYEYIKERNIYK